MDRSRHNMTDFNDEKTHVASNSTLFGKLNVNNALYEVELAKAEIEHHELIIVGFFILQYKKLRIYELYNFFTKFCDVNKSQELEMDTDSLYLALAKKELEDCIRQEMKAELERQRSKDCTDSFTADAVANMVFQRCCDKHKKHDRDSLDSSKRNSDAQRCSVYVAKLTAAMLLPQTTSNSIVKV